MKWLKQADAKELSETCKALENYLSKWDSMYKEILDLVKTDIDKAQLRVTQLMILKANIKTDCSVLKDIIAQTYSSILNKTNEIVQTVELASKKDN
jgi:hypothetical protein